MSRPVVVVVVLLLAGLAAPATSESNHDERCSCRCPETSSVDETIVPDFPKRKIYINATVKAPSCDCEHVVKPVLNLNQDQVDKLCPRCQCKHEARSTITIKVVVILILWIISMLVLYLVFLVCIEPFVTARTTPRVQVRRGTNLPYQSQRDEGTEGSIDNDTNVNATPLRSTSSGPRAVVNRLGREADKWKRQVQVQRSSVYDTHSMLN